MRPGSRNLSAASSSSSPESSKKEDHHAVVSTFDLFSIGIGPSSSHTVGPMRAARIFVGDLVAHKVIDQVAKLRVDVYGSLALTGLGHGTPSAILMGIEGETPEGIDTSSMQARIDNIHRECRIQLASTHAIDFNPKKDLILQYGSSLPQHPNGMRLTAFTKSGDMLATNEYFSIGGGFVVNDQTQMAHGENLYYKQYDSDKAAVARRDQDLAVATLPFTNALDLMKVCEREGMSIAQVVHANELQWRSATEIRDKCLDIWKVMDGSIRNGCLSEEPYLPGSLGVKRRAPSLYRKLLRGLYPSTDLSPSLQSTATTTSTSSSQQDLVRDGEALRPRNGRKVKKLLLPALDYLSVYAIAVNEENAAGGRVVTAPTNGAAGVIPAVLKYYLEFVSEDPTNDIVDFLLTAAAIGMLYKRGASISAAEMGCQGEVGVACSMSAAAFAAVMGGTIEQVENAAEIGMEHNLGLTCDPVDGLVQIPCIERNALGAVKAVTAAQLALNEDGAHRVTLDQVIETMRQTGMDMQHKYRETSLGGLAVNVPLC
ncbi:L-serine dehydratase [Piptocephalis cylindrospora]|uniref:L-serine dehydratase n=1 Tax=Piptocephalis cylindrospora TaxID=1907219 RepID=A0A4P9Y054_9FUNG|nr:L-serine dehydratase [Piptocephalis cylindrospora]|eukprot:RKP12024.1 L-serine dehydratase [Piptocephalis cylindrospora]